MWGLQAYPIGGGDLCFGKSTVWRMGLRNGKEIHEEVVRFSSRETMVALAKMGMVVRRETGSRKRRWEVEFRVLGGCRWRQAQVSSMFEQCCFSGGDSTSWVENRKRKGCAGGGDFWRCKCEVPVEQLSSSSQ